MKQVLLVHGIWDTSKVFRRLSKFLEERGYEPHGIDLNPNDARDGLEPLAEQVKDYAEKNFEGKFALVGFSMGGMIARYYIQKMGGSERVRKLITLSSPHNGTWTAHFIKSKGAKQLAMGSEFLKDLNADTEALANVNFTSLWTPMDLMVVPSWSSCMPNGVKNIMVPSLFHAWMLIHPKAHESIAKILKS